MDADIEPLTQDPTLLLTAMAGQVGQPNPLTEAIHLQLPLEAHQGLPYAYKEGFQASPDLARTIQVHFKKEFWSFFCYFCTLNLKNYIFWLQFEFVKNPKFQKFVKFGNLNLSSF